MANFWFQLTELSCLHTEEFLYHMFIFRETLKRMRPFQTTSKTSDHASIAPALLPNSMRVMELRMRRMKMTN